MVLYSQLIANLNKPQLLKLNLLIFCHSFETLSRLLIGSVLYNNNNNNIIIIIIIIKSLLTYSRQVAIYKVKIPILKYPRHKKLLLSSLSSSSYHICHDIMVTTTSTNTTIIIITLINIFHTNWYIQGKRK